MNCDDLLQQLNSYVDGEIDPQVCAQLQQHLKGCNPCRVVVDNIKKTISIYKNDQQIDVPLRYKQCLHDALREKWKQVHEDD